MKKIYIALVSIMIMINFAFAANQETIKVYVDDELVVFEDQEPVIVSGRTLVPLKGIFNALGASVKWNGEERSVVARKQDSYISMAIGDDYMRVDGEKVTLEVPSKIMNSRTMIPLRAVSEALKADVKWVGESRTINIKSKQDGDYLIKSVFNDKKIEGSYSSYDIYSEYPYIENKDNNEVISKINTEIKSEAEKWFNDIVSEKENEVLTQEDYGMPHEELEASRYYIVKYNKNGYLSLLLKYYQYTGGAHGMHAEDGITYELKTGEKVTAEEMLNVTEEEKKALIKKYTLEMINNDSWEWKDYGAEDYFDRKYEFDPEYDPYQEIKWYLGENKVIFAFSEYAIAPYAAGMVEVEVPIN